MRYFLSKLRGALVRERQAGQLLGMLAGVVVNPEDGKVVAYEIFSNRKRFEYVIPSDVVSWGTDNLTISEESAMMTDEELPRAKKVILAGGRLIGLKGEAADGADIGKVKDLQIDLEKDLLTKIYFVKKKFLIFTVDRRLVSRNKIVKITPKKIIISDNLQKESILSPIEEIHKERV